jgi:tetratricopeptide (TPR) repeat protein
VGRADDAIELEKVAIELLANFTRSGGLLFSVLQLNLGRLYRNLGFTEQALGLFRTALENRDPDLSPYVLLLFYGSLAHLHASRDETAAVLSYFHAFFEVARDLDLENVGYPVLDLLSRASGQDLAGRLTRGDEVLFHLYLTLARVSRQLGLDERCAAYLAGMRSRWIHLGEEIWQAAEALLGETAAAQPADGPAAVTPRPRRHLDEMVREVAVASGVVDAVATALTERRAVAVVRQNEVGPNVWVTDSLVLYDPRQRELGRQLASELGVASGHYPPASGQSPPAARAALVLPRAASLFSVRIAPAPLVFQEATLKREHRGELAGLVPFHLRVQVMAADFDGFLFEVLAEFAARTGIAALAVIPFHLRRRPLAQTPERAVVTFLASSVDYLVLDDRLLEKPHGARSEKNLLRFRPALAEQASIVEPASGEDTFRLRIRVATQTSELQLRGELLPLLRLCDGQSTVAGLVDQLDRDLDSPPDLEGQVCGFLRQLWHHGAIHLGEPVWGSPGAARGMV